MELAEKVQETSNEMPGNVIDWFRELFDDAVNIRRISDVPVGVLLSGGMDSSSVSASLSMQAETQVSSFTVRFKETGYDEGPFAQQVASRWGLDYHELFVSENDILNYLGEVSFLNDEPLVHGNDLHLWMISKYAKSRVTVLLSGEGADETLGGYVRYQPLKYPLLLKTGRYILPTLNKASLLNGRWRKLGRFLSLDLLDDFVQFNSCDVLPVDLNLLGFLPQANFPYRKQIFGIAKMLYPGEPVRQVMYYDQHTFLCSILDRNDRMTMGASIECRVPFLDYRLVEGLAALPSSIDLKVVLANGFPELQWEIGSRKQFANIPNGDLVCRGENIFARYQNFKIISIVWLSLNLCVLVHLIIIKSRTLLLLLLKRE